jgi:FHA domain-containing protein
MDEPLAVALKFGFLAVLYLFLFWVARSALRDLSSHEVVAGGGEPEARGRRRNEGGSELRRAVEPRLEVIAAMGHDPGSSWDIGSGATMGRSDGADIRVDDPFASSAHARIFPREDFMHIEDMGSTNGTYLNGRQLRTAERLKVADVIRIGDSEYRYQE